jgi:hypothetical protein
MVLQGNTRPLVHWAGCKEGVEKRTSPTQQDAPTHSETAAQHACGGTVSLGGVMTLTHICNTLLTAAAGGQTGCPLWGGAV